MFSNLTQSPGQAAALDRAWATIAATLAALKSTNGDPQIFEVAASTDITTAGLWLATAPGIVLSLAPAAVWGGGKVTVMDFTGAANPNVKVAGVVNRDPGGALINIAFEALAFTAHPARATWLLNSAS